MDLALKNTQNLVEALKTPEGTIAFAKQMGIAPETLIERLLGSDISENAKEIVGRVAHKLFVEEPKLTPQQIEDRKKLTDYERLKRQEDERKKQEITQKQQAEMQGMYKAIKGEVSKSVLEDKTLAHTEENLRRLIDKIRVVNRNFKAKQGRDLSMDEVKTVIPKAIGWVHKDNQLHRNAMIEAVKGDSEKLISLVGEDMAMAISRALISRVQARQKEAGKKPAENPQRRESVTEKIDRELGRTPQGFKVMNI
jgi:hypothetical protein